MYIVCYLQFNIILFHIYFLVQIQRNDYKYNMEERHEKAFIRKKAFVECVKESKKINCCVIVLIYLLVCFQMFGNTTHAPYHILSPLTHLAPRLLYISFPHIYLYLEFIFDC